MHTAAPTYQTVPNGAIFHIAHTPTKTNPTAARKRDGHTLTGAAAPAPAATGFFRLSNPPGPMESATAASSRAKTSGEASVAFTKTPGCTCYTNKHTEVLRKAEPVSGLKSTASAASHCELQAGPQAWQLLEWGIVLKWAASAIIKDPNTT